MNGLGEVNLKSSQDFRNPNQSFLFILSFEQALYGVI